MKTVDHKCPSCNASINYNPKEKNWVCEYCGGKFTLDELKANEENFKKILERIYYTDYLKHIDVCQEYLKNPILALIQEIKVL